MAGNPWIFLLAAAASVYAQSGDDAATLVQEAGAAALAAKTWRAEGKLITAGSDGKDQPPVSFKIAYQLPRYARLETAGGDRPMVRICEGTAQWTYYPDLKGYIRVLLPQIGPCAFPLNAWPPIGGTLKSPVFAGTETITVNGQPQSCQVVRGDFTWQGRDPQVKETVTLCIERRQKRILRYQLRHAGPGPASTQTYTFSSLEVDPELAADLFTFQAPEGSRALATIDWLTPIPGAAPGVYRVSDAVSAPILTYMAPPAYPAEAALLTGGNTVALRVEIGRDGVPRALEVSRSLGLGLDEAAISCVRKWQFQPAMSAGGQVAVAATIFVHFVDPARK